MKKPELLIVGNPKATWCADIMASVADIIPTSVLSTDFISNPEIDYSEVRILVGAPPELAEVIPNCPRLEWVQSTWAGVDAISHYACDQIAITALKGVFDQVMSEYVLGWFLALERQIIRRATTRSWNNTKDGTLAGKRLGVMGTGTIGTAIAKAAKAFNIHCVGMNSDGRSVEHFERCYSTKNKFEFAKNLDYLVSVLPNTPATDRLIDEALLSHLNSGAIAINAGRGNVVDYDALIKALNTKQLRYAVLDVFTEEPLSADSLLWQQENLFITSHTAAPTPSDAIVKVFGENWRRFNNQEPLLYRVDPLKLY